MGPDTPTIDPAHLETALRKWGRAALSFDIFLGPLRYEFFESREVPGALVAFRRQRHTDVVLGEVLAPEEHLQTVCRSNHPQ